MTTHSAYRSTETCQDIAHPTNDGDHPASEQRTGGWTAGRAASTAGH